MKSARLSGKSDTGFPACDRIGHRLRRLCHFLALLLSGSVFSATTLTINELELQGAGSASVPVEFRSDSAVAAVQMDVLFDPAAYTAAAAVAGTLPDTFRVDSHLMEAGRLRVVVGAPSNAALVDGTVFRVPLTATDVFASFFPVVITNFALSTAQGAAVPGKIAPRVRLLNLTSGGNVNGHDGIQLAVDAGATDGTVAKVEYYVGGKKIGEAVSGTFSIVWSPVGSGPFEITAIAYDSNGLATESRAIPIVVTNVGTTALKGLYAGLVKAATFEFGTTGYLQFATTANGAFTAKLTMGGETFSRTGRFAQDGTARVRFLRTNHRPPLTLMLQQYATRLIDQIAGQLTDGTVSGGTVTGSTFIADVLADRSVWRIPSRQPAERGNYTVVLPSAVDAATDKSPLGDGIGLVTVSRSGAITAALTLAHGRKVAQGTFMSKDKRWPFFASLYGNRGVIAGELDFADNPDVSDFAGSVDWFRPGIPGAASFSNGFTTNLFAIGSRYRIPGNRERVLALADGAGNASFDATDGGLANPLMKTLTIGRNNSVRVVDGGIDQLSLTLFPDSGLFSGTFIQPGRVRATAFQGVILQKQNLGTGFFSGDPLGGAVSIEPKP